MPGNSTVKLIKDPVPGHEALAGAAFFGRTAEVDNCSGEVVFFQICPDGLRCRNAGAAEQVMSAAMAISAADQRLRPAVSGLLAQSREGIEFPEDTDYRTSLAPASGERCRDTGKFFLNREPQLPQDIEVQVASDRTNSIRGSLHEVEFTLMLSVVLLR